MQNKTDSWLDDALDCVPSQEVPPTFRRDLEQRLREEGLRQPQPRLAAPASAAAPARGLRLLRPVLSAAAAVLLVAVGYQLGAGTENEPAVTIAPEGEIADAELIELYELRDVIESWDLASDEELEPGFQADDAAWLDSVLSEESGN